MNTGKIRVGDENAKEMKRRCVRDEARRVRERRWKLMGIDMRRTCVREKVKIGKDDREKQGERRETESGLRNNLDFCGCRHADVVVFGGGQILSLCFTF